MTEILSALALIVSVIALLRPIIRERRAEKAEVRASITAVDDSTFADDLEGPTQVRGRLHKFTVASKNLSKTDGQVWIVVHALGNGLWYPIRFERDAADQTFMLGAVGDAGVFQIVLYLVPPSLNATFRQAAQREEGLEFLPTGLHRLSVRTVERLPDGSA